MEHIVPGPVLMGAGHLRDFPPDTANLSQILCDRCTSQLYFLMSSLVVAGTNSCL